MIRKHKGILTDRIGRPGPEVEMSSGSAPVEIGTQQSDGASRPGWSRGFGLTMAILGAVSLAGPAPETGAGGSGSVDCNANPSAPGCGVVVGAPDGDRRGGNGGGLGSMTNRRLMACLVGALALLVTACSADETYGSPPTPPPATASATPSLEPADAAEKDVLTAYRGMWDALVEAGKVSDPDDPDLRKYASDQALRLIVNALYINRQQGEVILGELILDPQISALVPAADPTTATVLDCVNDENWLEYKASGGLVNEEPGGRHRMTATVDRTAEGWRVSSFILEEAGTC
ncbi:hypothetical protein O7632_10175 [Solwaraspora sp. WMMD406]|uniref:hypothetical protein n=1 Tax=Solwaraspora sp. WMMD406 TaxID=3016095 RepID=UPI00241764B0|nr:hypothetical protein [Solwaraspora sp. WMMD406]MDG4764467.1 hypothetical protein [Solwaraspora sp. WMMD406]